jgi:phospholipid/cholesterol/gamma-HCH transport system ATP-binding protein
MSPESPSPAHDDHGAPRDESRVRRPAGGVASPERASAPVVEVDDVHLAFGEKKVLVGLDLRIARGETLVLLGESGGGKTVLLRVILGLIAPDHGRVRLFEEDILGKKEDDLLEIRKRCAVVYQGGALFSALNVGENVALALTEILGLPPDEIKKRVRESIEAVGLSDLKLEQMTDELSGGMKKRVAVARAIAPKPEFIVYDEPTSGLDPPNSVRIFTLIKELHDRLKVSSLVVTHDVGGACRIANRIVLLADGNIAFDGTPDQFLASDQANVAEFRASSESLAPSSPEAPRPPDPPPAVVRRAATTARPVSRTAAVPRSG